MASLGKCKLVVIGDGAVGKTSLLATFLNREFPDSYVPTVIDNFEATLPVKKDFVKLSVWDTAGQEDWESLRLLAYDGADVFMVCYSTISASSLTNAKQRWLKEVEKTVPNPVHILIGTKMDLKEKYPKEAVETSLAETHSKKIGSHGFRECSALHFEDEATGGIKGVFAVAINAFLSVKHPRRHRRGFCTLI